MSPTPAWGAVILAAGEGRRMGGRPKGALCLDGVPILRRQVLALQACGVGHVVVVLGRHAAALAPLVADLGVQAVTLPPPTSDLITSQRAGLAQLPPRVDAAMLLLADQVLLNEADLREVQTAWAGRDPAVHSLYPVVAGQRGHPVLLSRSAVAAVCAQAEGQGVRHWQQQAGPMAVQAWASGNTHFVTDVDTPDDVRRLDAELGGGRLCWPEDGEAMPAQSGSSLSGMG